MTKYVVLLGLCPCKAHGKAFQYNETSVPISPVGNLVLHQARRGR
jgi:hypothetical protein